MFLFRMRIQVAHIIFRVGVKNTVPVTIINMIATAVIGFAIIAMRSRPTIGLLIMTDIFVFGSNLAGRHGKGAALDAVRYHGAIKGVGWGLQGESYAIPTKDFHIKRLPLPLIQHFVYGFMKFAWHNPQLDFRVTAIGCGLAGYKPAQIAPFFNYHPPNVYLPYEFMY